MKGLQNIQHISDLLKEGKIGVIPTDTIYGIVGLALNPQTVEEIYILRKRSLDKPMIILISSLNDLKKFDVKLTGKQADFLKKVWPNPLSVVLSCPNKKFQYLHRGENSLAFRIPKDQKISEILKAVGPLVAPSANFEGDAPSQNIDQAKKYFADKVAFYVDGGEIKARPSKVVRLNNEGSLELLRP